MSITVRLKRYAYLLMVVLPLCAVVVALWPAVAQAQETNRTAAAGSAEDLVVAPGDTLWSISEELLGPSATPQQIAHGVELIYAHNRDTIGEDPDAIFAGQKLSLPPVLERQAGGQSGAAGAGEEAKRAPGTDRTEPRAAAQGAPAAADAPEAEQPANLPAVAAVAAVPAVRAVAADGAPSAPEEFFAADGRQLLGLGMMLTSLLIAAAILAWVAISAIRRESARRRSRRGYSLAYGLANRSAYPTPFVTLAGHQPDHAGRPHANADQKIHTLTPNNRRRQVMGVNQRGSGAPHEWEIDVPLRRSLENLPLEHGVAAREALVELKPHVEDALETLALLEKRRPLSEKEHRQANSLRGLSSAIEHTLGDHEREGRNTA